jgi:toxin ParE1/3/4
MPKIERSSRAKADILVGACYIAEQSQNRAAAKRWIDAINEKLQLLARHPHAGEIRPDLGRDVRAFPMGNYIIFYRPSEQGIELLRVLHGSRDIPEVFRQGLL